jgi:hypothetical protein
MSASPLTTAATMYREMDMRFWLAQAEAEMQSLPRRPNERRATGQGALGCNPLPPSYWSPPLDFNRCSNRRSAGRAV